MSEVKELGVHVTMSLSAPIRALHWPRPPAHPTHLVKVGIIKVLIVVVIFGLLEARFVRSLIPTPHQRIEGGERREGKEREWEDNFIIPKMVEQTCHHSRHVIGLSCRSNVGARGEAVSPAERKGRGTGQCWQDVRTETRQPTKNC